MSIILNKSLLATKCHLTFVRVFCTVEDAYYDKMFPDEINTPNEIKDSNNKSTVKQNSARAIKVIRHFTSEPHLNDVKADIPSKHFFPKRRLTLRHLYLVDKRIAKSVESLMRPFLLQNKEQIVCETNAGLGLITRELLEKGVPLVRLYETCPEFRQLLKNFEGKYPNRVELFVKDFYHLGSFFNMDKYDGGDRVKQLLSAVPKREWSDDPVMTIVGPLPSLAFINYLIRMLSLQQGVITYGRIQIFALMRPMDYMKLVSTSEMNLHVYQALTVLFQLFFDCELLEKYPRKSFLPWETKPKDISRIRAHSKIDMDYIYLVRINFKKSYPIEPNHVLHFYYFLKQGFIKGRTKVIPTVEKWLPGVGVNLIVPAIERRAISFPNMNIYTEFGNLSPTQILQVFLEMLDHPEYKSSPFAALVESQLLKSETIESDLADVKSSRNIENLQEKLH